MIETRELTKRFGDIVAVNSISASIRDGSVFGLIGTNGAGKSTFLRMLCGILKPDEGTVTIDGKSVYENLEVKSRFFYISDDQYFFNNATPEEMMGFYQKLYPKFDKRRFIHLMESFELDRRRKINTFSKGMRKQVSVICGICAGTDYLFCDETFDGLDPVMRQAVKSIFAGDMQERNLTPIIASHNLRELEDICDHVGLLHKGGILLSKELDDMKLNIHKIQCVLTPGMAVEEMTNLDIVKKEERGSLLTLTVRGSREQVEEAMASYHPIFAEVIRYDIKKLVL